MPRIFFFLPSLAALLLLPSCGPSEKAPPSSASKGSAQELSSAPPVSGEDASEARTALVIGVDDYHDTYFTKLEAPDDDARRMAEKLRTLGFEVTLRLNPNRGTMNSLADEFGQSLARRRGVGLFYFSGHGSMKPDEADPNFLIPAGTNIASREDLPQEAFNAQRVANRMKEAGNRLNLVFLDACRSNDLPSRGKNAGAGLASMRGASGLMFFFATQPNEIALEARETTSSVFTDALLAHMSTPGLSFMDMMADVTAATEKASLTLTADSDARMKQSPFMSGTLSGRFSFAQGEDRESAEVAALRRQVEALKQTPPAPPAPPAAPTAAATVVAPATSASAPGAAELQSATNEKPFINTLKMEFVPVKATPGLLWSRWETRVQDYEVFCRDTGHAHEKPSFSQGDDHPVVNASFEDAQAFCEWLSKKERKTYRLPTDHEWSGAVGIGAQENASASPKSKHEGVKGVYPWGSAWPPPQGCGNLSSWLKVDSFDTTSPAGRFKPTSDGLYDLSGNVLEWCDSECVPGYPQRVLRGGSFAGLAGSGLLSSDRDSDFPASEQDCIGFRVVLVVGGGG
jgi:formylglycine-generating enzyme required for sulfatase activity